MEENVGYPSAAAGAKLRRVRIGCVPHAPLQQLQAFLGALALRLPDAAIEVAHLRTAEQVRRLGLGKLDLGLVDDVRHEAGLHTEPLFDGERLAALLPSTHDLASNPAVELRELRHETLLLFPRSVDPALHDWFTALARADGQRFSAVREIGDADLRDVLLAVAEGHGVTLAPRSVLANAGAVAALVTARDLEPPQRSPATLLAWSRTSPPAEETIVAAGRAARQLSHPT
jgi:DNA-binding transcriptional LysR family regulator